MVQSGHLPLTKRNIMVSSRSKRSGLEFALLLALVGSLAPNFKGLSQWLSPPDPIWEGKRLGAWLEDVDRDGLVAVSPKYKAATNAVAQLGNRAVPYLFH